MSRFGRSRYTRRRVKITEELPLTSLIDTALTLLIIFMITSPMVHNAIKINLPQGNSKEDTGLAQKIVFIIDEHKQLYLDNKPISLQELKNGLCPDILQHSRGTVHVKADAVAPYGFVMDVVDQLKMQDGVTQVVLLIKQRSV